MLSIARACDAIDSTRARHTDIPVRQIDLAKNPFTKNPTRLRDPLSRSFGALDIFIGGLWADVADERQRVDFLEFGSRNIASLETLRLLAMRWNFEFAPSPGPRGAKAVLGDGGIRVAGIDVEALAGDKIRIIRGQKNRRADKIFRFAQATHGNAPQALSRFRASSRKIIHRSADERVHVNAIVSQRLGDSAGHRIDAGVGSAVTRRLA